VSFYTTLDCAVKLTFVAMPSPTPLRETFRALRRATPLSTRQHAARQLAERVAALRIFAAARHIAGYLAFDGEIDPAPLLERALALGKHVYLPVLTSNPGNAMLFARYQPGLALKPNRFGIPEPQVSGEALLAPEHVDLVLTPLVAFDISGNRLGMGGGFYDRTFAFERHPGHHCRPLLLGLAYELQKVEHLNRRPWDVTLDGIATEQALYPGSNGLLE
jgi:5-formyltetrahydrofolate cyclo-ligase